MRWKKKRILKSLKCTTCGNKFMTSPYIWKMKRQSLPKMCQKCLQEFENENRKKYYNENKKKFKLIKSNINN